MSIAARVARSSGRHLNERHWRLDPQFTADEQSLLRPYFTNLDGPVFALTNLPEVVKGALFARYSRSAKGLRRLFLDEFVTDEESAQSLIADELIRSGRADDDATSRAAALYERVFTEYGDDSVAQLGSAHLACEDVSNVATKAIERGRLMSYLEQSTRYIRYDQRIDGRYRYRCPFTSGSDEAALFTEVVDGLFELYTELYGEVEKVVEAATPREDKDSPTVYKAAVRAKVCDALRGLLPAATLANVGLHGSGQAFEALILRLLASENREANEYGALILDELKKVIPSFVRRIEIPERGGAWIEYLRSKRKSTEDATRLFVPSTAQLDSDGDGTRVTLTSFDSDGELRIAGAILFESGIASDSAARRLAASMSADELRTLFDGYVGERSNRRHRPGRAFEATSYRFEVVSDYGAFRDLQRHRILTIEWQPLDTNHGFTIPDLVVESGLEARWREAMERAESSYAQLASADVGAAAYLVPMAFRIRYVLEMNAREAMHLIELRTSPQGHPEYRRVCQEMHRLIDEVAGHRRIAASMSFVGGDEVGLERLESERRAEERRSKNN